MGLALENNTAVGITRTFTPRVVRMAASTQANTPNGAERLASNSGSKASSTTSAGASASKKTDETDSTSGSGGPGSGKHNSTSIAGLSDAGEMFLLGAIAVLSGIGTVVSIIKEEAMGTFGTILKHVGAAALVTSLLLVGAKTIDSGSPDTPGMSGLSN